MVARGPGTARGRRQRENGNRWIGLASVILAGLVSCRPAAKETYHQERRALASRSAVPKVTRPGIVINPRTGLLAHFPCSPCHARGKATAAPATLGPHRDMRFEHMADVTRCGQCHNAQDMDTLVLFSGQAVSIDESVRLCGQCHGEKRRDWVLGIHGKQVGSWQGVAHRYTCADCHEAHRPRRDTMRALPPPPFPRFGIAKREH